MSSTKAKVQQYFIDRNPNSVRPKTIRENFDLAGEQAAEELVKDGWLIKPSRVISQQPIKTELVYRIAPQYSQSLVVQEYIERNGIRIPRMIDKTVPMGEDFNQYIERSLDVIDETTKASEQRLAKVERSATKNQIGLLAIFTAVLAFIFSLSTGGESLTDLNTIMFLALVLLVAFPLIVVLTIKLLD